MDLVFIIFEYEEHGPEGTRATLRAEALPDMIRSFIAAGAEAERKRKRAYIEGAREVGDHHRVDRLLADIQRIDELEAAYTAECLESLASADLTKPGGEQLARGWGGLCIEILALE